MQLTEIRIAGFGGQGVILSAIVLGRDRTIGGGRCQGRRCLDILEAWPQTSADHGCET